MFRTLREWAEERDDDTAFWAVKGAVEHVHSAFYALPWAVGTAVGLALLPGSITLPGLGATVRPDAAAPVLFLAVWVWETRSVRAEVFCRFP